MATHQIRFPLRVQIDFWDLMSVVPYIAHFYEAHARAEYIETQGRVDFTVWL